MRRDELEELFRVLMAKVFDFRNGESYFFLEQLLTASLVRTAGLERPNIVVKCSKKELRASQLRLPRALPNDCSLAPIPQRGTKARGKGYLSWAQRCTAIHGPYWKDTELEHKFLALTTPQGWEESTMHATEGGLWGGGILFFWSYRNTKYLLWGDKYFR